VALSAEEYQPVKFSLLGPSPTKKGLSRGRRLGAVILPRPPGGASSWGFPRLGSCKAFTFCAD